MQQSPPAKALNVAILGVPRKPPPPRAEPQLSGQMDRSLREGVGGMFKFEIPTRIGGAMDRSSNVAAIPAHFAWDPCEIPVISIQQKRSKFIFAVKLIWG